MKAEPQSLARELLAAARAVADRGAGTRGLWPRAAVFLARQALEVALKTYWSSRAPGVEACSHRAQLLCLGTFLSDEPRARASYQAWSALSEASHYHPYELTPTREELLLWFEAVEGLIETTERKLDSRFGAGKASTSTSGIPTETSPRSSSTLSGRQ